MGFVGSSALVLFQLRATGEYSYPTHGIWGCATSIIGFLFCLSSRSSSSSRAQKSTLAIGRQMIILVVDKGNLQLCKGMTVIVEGLLRLGPVTSVIGSRNSTLRPRTVMPRHGGMRLFILTSKPVATVSGTPRFK